MTEFLKELSHKSNYNVCFFEKNIVMMGKNDVKVVKHKGIIGNKESQMWFGMVHKSQRWLVMINDHLGWSKVIWVGQRLFGLNSIDFDTLKAVILKK